MKLGVLTSHPIQYQAPLFRALAREVELKVFFAHQPKAREQGEAGFGVAFEWDVDLLDGYCHVFLENRSRHPNVNKFSGCDTPSIRDYIAQGNFDAFLVTGWYLKSFWQAVFACHKEGIPVMSRGDSQLSTPRSLLKKILKAVVYRWGVQQFDAHLFVGQRNREYLAHYGVKPKMLFFSPHFVDNNYFRTRAEEVDKENIRRNLDCSNDQLLIIFVGKFIDKKRPLDLIDALGQLQQQGVSVKGGFVGSGVLEEDMRKKAKELGVDVFFAGFKNQSNLPQFYAAADLLALPSDGGETWGLVVNEAMACGLPAVVSDQVGCGPDLIEKNMTGGVFPVGNATELANSIRDLKPLLGSVALRELIEGKMREYSVGAAVKGILAAAEDLRASAKNKK